MFGLVERLPAVFYRCILFWHAFWLQILAYLLMKVDFWVPILHYSYINVQQKQQAVSILV